MLVLGTEQASDLGAFFCIPYLLNVFNVRSTLKNWRLSHQEVKEAFIGWVKSEAEVSDYIKLKQDNCVKKDLPLVPFIFGIGSSFNEAARYVVVINKIEYSFNSVLSAVDCCFKSFWVFNLNYTLECKLVWTFIQLAFYRIKSENDSISNTINSLLCDLEITIADLSVLGD